jgi:hypothetical protein
MSPSYNSDESPPYKRNHFIVPALRFFPGPITAQIFEPFGDGVVSGERMIEHHRLEKDWRSIVQRNYDPS